MKVNEVKLLREIVYRVYARTKSLPKTKSLQKEKLKVKKWIPELREINQHITVIDYYPKADAPVAHVLHEIVKILKKQKVEILQLEIL